MVRRKQNNAISWKMYSQFAVITLVVTASLAFFANGEREQEELANAVERKAEEAKRMAKASADAGMLIRDDTYDGRAAAIAYDSEFSGGGGGGGIPSGGIGYYYGPEGDTGIPSAQVLAEMGLTADQWENMTGQQRADAYSRRGGNDAATQRSQTLASAKRSGTTSTSDAPF